MNSTNKEYVPAEKEEVDEFVQYLTFRYRRMCNGMDMIDMLVLDGSLTQLEKEIKNKKIKGPMRNAVSDYTRIIRAISEGKIIISKDIIKKFKEVKENAKNIRG